MFTKDKGGQSTLILAVLMTCAHFLLSPVK
jgi:hypothetical protein